MATNNNGVKQIFAAGNFYPFRVQLGREDAGKAVLLQWDESSHRLVAIAQNMGIHAGGDVRDVLSIQTAKHDQLIILATNNDSLQVIKRN